MNNSSAHNTSTSVQEKLLAALDKADLRNQKGREAIHNLIIKPHAVRLISDTVKANNGDRIQYVTGLLALIEKYECGAGIVVRTLCESVANEAVSAHFLEKKIIPLLLELGIILKFGERSYQWQVAEQLGRKPNAIRVYFSNLLDVSDSKQALRKQQLEADNERRRLAIANKQAQLAQRRKQVAMQAANNAAEAERLAVSLPQSSRPMDVAKQYAMPALVVILLAMVVIGGAMDTGTPANSPQLALEPTIEVQQANTGSLK